MPEEICRIASEQSGCVADAAVKRCAGGVLAVVVIITLMVVTVVKVVVTGAVLVVAMAPVPRRDELNWALRPWVVGVQLTLNNIFID